MIGSRQRPAARLSRAGGRGAGATPDAIGRGRGEGNVPASRVVCGACASGAAGPATEGADRDGGVCFVCRVSAYNGQTTIWASRANRRICALHCYDFKWSGEQGCVSSLQAHSSLQIEAMIWLNRAGCSNRTASHEVADDRRGQITLTPNQP